MIILILLLILLVLYIWYKISQRIKVNRIQKFIKKNDKILDFGCGTCCTTAYLKKLGYKNIIGMDIENKSECLIPEIYNGINIPYPDKYFDTIICSFVLHHIKNYKNILNELLRVTKKNIIIYEDTPENWIDKKLTRLHSKSHWGQSYSSFNNKKEWIDIFKKLPVKIEYIKDVSRYEFPFGDYPYIYPVPATFFVLKNY